MARSVKYEVWNLEFFFFTPNTQRQQVLRGRVTKKIFCILSDTLMVTSRPPHHLLVLMRIRRRINWVALYFGLHFIAVVILTPLHELDPYWEVSESGSDLFPLLLLPFLFFLVWYFWGFAKWCLICFKTNTKTKKKTETERLRAI